eukprot:1315619-Rhodomonas_salina.1
MPATDCIALSFQCRPDSIAVSFPKPLCRPAASGRVRSCPSPGTPRPAAGWLFDDFFGSKISSPDSTHQKFLELVLDGGENQPRGTASERRASLTESKMRPSRIPLDIDIVRLLSY